MSFWDYPWTPGLLVGIVVAGFAFCFFICRCSYSIYLKINERSTNIPSPQPAVNHIYTTYDEEVLRIDRQSMTGHFQTTDNDTSYQETYPSWQQEGLSGNVLPPAYDSVMPEEKLTLWSKS